MNISHNWLNDYIEHGLTPQGVADTLTMLGLEEEESWTFGETFEGLVVGYVAQARRHPNADKLTVCDVVLQDGSETTQIVCGAPNVAAGQKVVVATPGTKLMLPAEKHNPEAERKAIEIKKGKIRGEESHGMICSAMELGLSEDHSGIMVLEAQAEIGQTFAAYLATQGQAVSDVVTDVNITPNRPDAISHLGIARDLAAVTGRPVKKPKVTMPENGGKAAEKFSVEIECPEVCHRYVGLLVEGVRIGPSPRWMQQRLEAIGLRPRNNVVDVTNYVMYECGQPLHAFDFDQLAGRKIIVRQTQGEEKFTTLDSKARILPAGTIMICDADREVAIGGIMGGENSEVTETTVNVLIESAWFDPATIRKAAKSIREEGKDDGRISTDASYRFERGVDPEGQVWAAARAAQLIVETAGGQLVPGMVDAHPTASETKVLNVRPSRVKAVVGAEIPVPHMIALLSAIGFEVTESAAGLECRVPSFRPDVEREIDVIEEIARLYGYDNIVLPTHSVAPNATPAPNPEDAGRMELLRFGAGLGFREMYTNSMVKAETARIFAGDYDIVETLNPISSEMGALRPTLLLSALPVVAHNLNNGRKNLRLMEVSHIYRKATHNRTVVAGYEEREHALFLISGSVTQGSWNTTETKATIFDAKGVVEALFSRFNLGGKIEWVPVNTPSALNTYQITLQMGQKVLGTIARLNDQTAKRFEIKQDVFYAELDWTALFQMAQKNARTKYQDISKFPAVERDLAVTVDRSVAAGDLLETIRRSGGKLLQDVRIFDLYEGDKIAAGKKSIAFSLRLGSVERTLVDKEIDHFMSRVIKQLADRHQAELRA